MLPLKLSRRFLTAISLLQNYRAYLFVEINKDALLFSYRSAYFSFHPATVLAITNLLGDSRGVSVAL